MNLSAALHRDPFMPRQPQGNAPGLALATLAHLILVGALAFGVNWRTREPQPVIAELWSSVPQLAAPRAPEPTPTPPPQPVAKPPTPADTPRPDAQIAIEKEAQRKQAEREKQEKQEKAEKTKREAEQRKAAEEEKAQATKQAAAREANLKRMRQLAGATGGPSDTGNALHSSGPSAGYAGRIMARIKPNIVFNDSIDGNPVATVEVRLAPDGTIIAKRLLKSSGVKAWDDAVLRAIERTEVLPRDIDGRVPGPFPIDFRPQD